jgi:hypothetical protein
MATRRLSIVLGFVFAALTGFMAYYFYRRAAYALFVLFGCSICRDGVVSEFPMEVAFKFSHDGSVYEKSFLTVVHPSQGNWFETCDIYWLPTRHAFSINLQDGSVLIASFEWKQCNKLSHEGDVVSGTGSWIWFDLPSSPTRAVFGYFGSDHSTVAAKESPVEASRLDFRLRRASNSLLNRAEDNDRVDPDPLTGWHGNFVYGSPYEGNGLLYVQVVSRPVVITDADQYEWRILPDGCRIAYLPQHKEGRLLSPTLRWTEGRNAVKFDATWDLDNGSPIQGLTTLYPAKPTRARPPIGTFDAPTTMFDEDQQFAAMGQKCTMPAWPGSATAAIVDFGHGDLREIRPERWIESSLSGTTYQERR